ncbi:thyroid transcription factor 1-associated protein 26 [Eupeodes corollae]|uniref:thyroid transcription factor 1-associated protein 26 n=1 Tax=Eupeodes corollae TaxID=290404 RepID=UPI002490D0E2|nr:thyroid transcription factor 1-associated protein 26 [Eupeodes corollae]
MGKNRNDSNKVTPGKTKKVPFKAKMQRQKDSKPKPAQQRQNKAAELSRQKKQTEKAEKERRIMEFKKKRLEKSKVISKKTSRGQPLMKNRIEYLLKQIQEMKKH